MEHSRIANRPIGSPVERLEDLRFLRGRGQYVDDVPSAGCAACRDPAQLGGARPHPRGRRVGGAASVPACARSSPRPTCGWATSRSSPCGRSCCRSSSPTSSRSSPRTRCAMSASRSPSWWPTARRWPRTRWMRSRSTSRRCRRSPTARAARKNESLLFEATGRNHVITLSAVKGDADAAFKDAPYTRRERFEVQRFTAVTMEPRGLLAEWDDGEAPSHRLRHDQGGVPQPPHPGEADGARRGRHHHDRGRRRRRLRRARRVLSRGFPDPVRGAKAQAAR